VEDGENPSRTRHCNGIFIPKSDTLFSSNHNCLYFVEWVLRQVSFAYNNGIPVPSIAYFPNSLPFIHKTLLPFWFVGTPCLQTVPVPTVDFKSRDFP